MDILVLSDNFPPETNAPATRVFEHAREWARLGHRVRVITCAPNFPRGRVFPGYRNAWRARERVDGIEVLRVKTYVAPNRGVARRTLDQLSFLLSGGLAALGAERPDVLVATSPQFFAAVAGGAVARLRGIPFVFELRDLWPASIGAVGAVRQGLALRALERVELALYRSSAAVVAVSEAFRRDLVGRGIDPARVRVVTNGVDLARYAPAPRDPELARAWGLEGRLVVGYLGTQGMAHALERALDAAERLRARRDIAFLFVGDGAAREGLVAAARARKLENVVFREPVPKERMAAVWSLCDLALIHLKDTPVFATVIPSKLFEALGMGVPALVCAPEGEASAIVRGSGCGVALAPEDPAALAAAVERLAADPAERARLSRAARAAAPRYDRAALARAMLAVLEAAAEGRALPEASAGAPSAARAPATEPAAAACGA